MRLRKVISGGQTGADRAGLDYARALGLETGGTAPRGYRTERGADLSLKTYGLIESLSSGYPARTAQNVKDADVTLWFGNIGSPGYYCTLRACQTHDKSFIVNPLADEVRRLAELYEVWNVAGNRASKNAQVTQMVQDAFAVVAQLMPGAHT